VTDRPDNLAIDMFLADRAEAINGKLYVMGGAWDRLQVPELPGPLPVPISVAVVITVPWSLTNREFTFSLELVDVDNAPVPIPQEDGEEGDEGDLFSIPFEVGRPPGLRQGRPQKNVLSVTIGPGLEFEKPGTYSFRGMIDGEELSRATFDLVTAGPV
jgi:hypothetical protein